MSKHGIELVFEVADSIGYPKVSLSRAFVLTHEGVRRAPVENPELCRKMFSDCVWFGLTTKAVQEWEKLKGDPSPKG